MRKNIVETETNMKHITLNLLLLANSIMLISYMGLTINSNIEVNATETVPLFLSSLMLIDITYKIGRAHV